VIRQHSGIVQRFARLVLAAVAFFAIASCGSGGVSGPPAAPGPLAITPATATLYSGLPTTFIVSGGTGTYAVTSSDQLTIANVDFFTGSTLIVVPNTVVADTPVTLTLRDNGSATPTAATLTVKARTVSNIVTITPSASQSSVCGSSVCAGGDAEVKATLAIGGVPLVNRLVLFQVVSGDFGIITSAPGQAEATSLGGSTTTDAGGTARIRIRVLPEAVAQTALIQILDVNSGFSQRASFTIAPSTNSPLNAQPSTVAFIGRDHSSCANNVHADVIVFGGHPPYQLSNPGAFTLDTPVVSTSGGRFTITATGQCASGTPIAVVDANGATVTVTASNSPAAITQQTPPLVASPTTVTLDDCFTVANLFVAGGLGPPYYAASGNTLVEPYVTSSDFHTWSIHRVHGGTSIATPVTVTISDGQSVTNITVNLGLVAQGTC